MSLRIKYLWVCLPLWLAGCGFHPMYARDESTPEDSRLFAGVRVDKIPGRMGQQLQGELEDRLNPDGNVPVSPAYRLSVSLTTADSPIGISRDGTVSRYNVYLTSHYVLYRLEDNKAILSGDLRNVTSYNNITNAYFSTFISDEDAIRRGVVQLSELYRQRLSAYLREGAPVQTKITTTPPPPPVSSTPWNANPVLQGTTGMPQPL
jgi:LPS-assembly lipoprotein